jgi:apolipoprotein N-acyltransferase
VRPSTPAALSLPVRLGLVLVSAALLRLSLPPFDVAPLALVALAPFLIALGGLTPGRAAALGLAWGALAGAANASWFAFVFTGPLRPALLGLWLLLGIGPALYAFGHGVAARRGGATLAVFAPALWIATEWLRSEGQPLRFSWFTLGHALSGNARFCQNADLAGVYGLSLLAFGTSFLLERGWAHRRDGRGFVLVFFAVVLPLVAWSRGANILGIAPPLGTVPEGRQSLRVLVVQDEHQHSVEPKRTLTLDAVKAAGAAPDVIVWPEDSFSTDAFAPGDVRNALLEMARLARGVFVVGCEESTGQRDAGGRERVWNSALLLRPSGETLGTYHKRNPVQFIEPVEAGTESPVFDLDATTFGVFTCYDGTYPFVTRELVARGAALLVTPSMDDASWGRVQHLHHALFYPLRACEVRRPIVRACSSGVSLVLDAWGRELARIEPMDQGARVAVVVPESVMTPYSLGGFLLPFVALGLSLAGGLAAIVASLRARGARS